MELGWCFFTAIILKKVSVNSTPKDLSALPDLFEVEKLTQGGLPIIISVFGKFSISVIEFF